ncbi:serine/threonine-protein kinase 11-interacting protein isoform X2 [Hemibagrus wyckioides]|uniref:serine/threonine-protein kinase 11-interacting protein isoform X2 n=1 Tax=Hemibagrus wyckioides TaxID=337641 RepID=UPI00266DCD2E|nr:serine/threonine-protein kinase 11-interacting protein isoform X2 [Hemibagrus wyckioides]
MSATQDCQSTLVQSLATLLRNNGESVLDGSSTLTLQVTCVQHLTQLFEQYLLSCTHQHSFLALPSHPADTTTLLQVQFLFDMLQKTISLKLVHPPGVRLQSTVKIFPFKFLKHLELKRIPSHCLEGLRGVYSQLEVFICSKSLNTLEELLLLCGGDLSTALPWLELHTLNFSYNYISCLDESLSLLNILKSLDLSHNKIQECAEFLKPLCELKHLNLAYNNLQRVPELGPNTRARLVTLVLRHNQLENINGVEHLSSLQCLDLTFNMLMEHTQLAPLAFLHNLNMVECAINEDWPPGWSNLAMNPPTLNWPVFQFHCPTLLTLEGNPLYFQKTHRNATIYHLSPQAAFRGLQLDGSTLSSTELAVLSKPIQLIHQTSQIHQVAIAPEHIVQDMSSCGGELSDSLPTGEFGASRVYKRKSKKVKVRTASISEPSDTEPSSSSLQDIILCHQMDIEKLDSFREKMGTDWLRYQHHLHGTSAILSGPSVDRFVAQSIADKHCTPSPTLTRTDCTMPKLDSLHIPLLSSELKREQEGIMELQPETESTLQWTDHSFVDIESTLEKSPPEKGYTDPAFGEEEEDLGVDVCRPMLVRVLTETEDFNKRKESEPLFLRVHQAYILEVDMHQGCVRNRFELDSLRQVTTSQFTCTEEGKERCHSVLELRFNYISHERQKRLYLMLDDPQEALQVLLELLSRIAVENEHQAEKEKTAIVQLQCLKCQAEFSQPQSKKLMRALSEPDVYHEYQDRTKKEHAVGDAVFCPECTSDHVIQLAGQASPSASTPIHYGFNQTHDTCFGFDYIDTQKGESLRSPIYVRNSSEASTLPEVTTGIFLTAQCGLFKSVSSNIEDSPNHLISFHSSDSQVLRDQEGSENGLAQGCSSSQRLLNHQSLQDPQGYGHDVETVDHRLQLFLDVEVFEGEEEIHCFLKMSVVKFGDPVEFPSLVVVSNQRIYILEMTSQSEGHPSEWLQKRDSHRLCELSYLEVGLGSQIIHMEFDVSAAAYTLLVRDSAQCKHFYNQLEAKARELAPKPDSKLKTISCTQLNPKHHLWPLVYEGRKIGNEVESHPPFFYLLAFLLLGDSLSSVTVLATQESLFLLDEDHQWSKSYSKLANEEAQNTSRQVTIREMQPISYVSSILLFSSDPCQVNIQLYDELANEEKTWLLRAKSVKDIQGLVDWIKGQWEAMFGVKLITALQ